MARKTTLERTLIKALPNAGKLEVLAAWFDKHDSELNLPGDEVQADLRLWAKNIRAALSAASGRAPTNKEE